jgi:predicted secreted protein
MTFTTALAAFFLIWWVSLFAVLPWGVRSQHEGGEMAPGTDPGAPTQFRLGRKLLWTTAVAVVIYAGCFVVYRQHLVTLSDLMGPFDYAKY